MWKKNANWITCITLWILWCLRLQNKDMKVMHTTWTLYCINIVYIEILSMLTSRKYRQCWRCILNIGSTSSTSRCLQCWRQKEYKQCQQHKLINFMNRRLKSQVPWYSDKNACHSPFSHSFVVHVLIMKDLSTRKTPVLVNCHSMCTDSSDPLLSAHSFMMDCNPRRHYPPTRVC